MVSRRPDWFDHGMASARRVADVVVSRFHDSGSFADVLNDALTEARTLAPVALKVDDHDTYPDDHAAILDAWEPGVTLWGIASWVDCAGTEVGRRRSLCASAIPTDLTVTADHTGAVTASVMFTTRAVEVETGVAKRVCSEDWSWQRRPQTICPHEYSAPMYRLASEVGSGLAGVSDG
jgi:hypothetical protein